MVDEIYEVQQYLSGMNIAIPNLYRIFTLLAKWFREQGLDHDSIRDEIKIWAKNNGIYINYDLNVIIMKVFKKDKNNKLKSPIIKINETDIEIINDKFDNDKTKLTALAILCYAKAFANKNGEFTVSTVGLSAWTGLNRSGLSSRYMKELIKFKYISVIEKPKNSREWSNCNQSTKYKINQRLHNSGCATLTKNDLEKLFSEVFLSP